jgi:hypothetical protein
MMEGTVGLFEATVPRNSSLTTLPQQKEHIIKDSSVYEVIEI